MIAQAPVLLPVNIPAALTALEDLPFLADCTEGVFLPYRGDGVLRGNLTHLAGEVGLTYQLTVRIVEIDVDERRLRYDVTAREARGGSLGSMTVDSVLSQGDGQAVLTLLPHVVLTGPHGGHAHEELATAASQALSAVAMRFARRLAEAGVRDRPASQGPATEESADQRGERLGGHDRRRPSTPTWSRAAIATGAGSAAVTLIWLWMRRTHRRRVVSARGARALP